MKAQELTGADIIVTTCSTLTPAVELIRPFIQVPVIAIDDAWQKERSLRKADHGYGHGREHGGAHCLKD